MHECYTLDTIDLVEHPVPNDHFLFFLMMYSTTHLMGNFNNNWITKKW